MMIGLSLTLTVLGVIKLIKSIKKFYFIKNYYELSIEDRHKTLTALIDKIIYEKTKGGRWDEDARSSFTLELFLKI